MKFIYSRSRTTEHSFASYLLGNVSFFAGQLSLPLGICYALGELIL